MNKEKEEELINNCLSYQLFIEWLRKELQKKLEDAVEETEKWKKEGNNILDSYHKGICIGLYRALDIMDKTPIYNKEKEMRKEKGYE